MTDKQIIIDGCDVSGCLFYQTNFEEDYDVKIKHYCSNWHNSCESNNNSNCYYKQLLCKEQECEELKKELHKNFEEKDTLHLIIDRLLEASGYDTNTASAEDFEDVYEHMRYEQQQLDQLKAENKKIEQCIIEQNRLVVGMTKEIETLTFKKYELLQTLTEIKEIAKPHQRNIDKICGHCRRYDGCHACCIDDINCYQHKKPTTPACDKYCELKEFEINNIANQILQKTSEVLPHDNQQ